MIAAIITVCGLWAIAWCLGRKIASGWGILLPCALLPWLAFIDMNLNQLRLLVVVAMLATLAMLFHRRLRHYLLLPSCIAFVGGLAVISLNFNVF